MQKSLFFFLLPVYFFLTSSFCFAQDKTYAKNIVEKLSAPSMHGRGYVLKGDSIAASFIADEYAKHGLQRFFDTYYQPLTISVNTFPDTIVFNIGNNNLKPGIDFLPNPANKALMGTYPIYSVKIENKEKLRKLENHKHKQKAILVDLRTLKEKDLSDVRKTFKGANYYDASIFIELLPKKMASWGVSKTVNYATSRFTIFSDSLKFKNKKVYIHINQKYYPKYNTQNVVGYIEGKLQPDTFIVFTAHYDHLGRLGNDTYFPGANDNAGGVAMMLDFARYLSLIKDSLKYSFVFIACAAEEAGLLGSCYFVDNTPIDLKRIKCVLNLDLVGNGEKGARFVNGTVHKEDFNLFQSLNDKYNFLISIQAGGAANNSDHACFHEKGVKSFFIFTLGGSGEYHSVNDTIQGMSLAGYDGLFQLILKYINM